MKAWIAAALFCTGMLRADLTVVQKVEENGTKRPPEEMRLKIKGTKIRADIAPEITLLMDTATGDTATLYHHEKRYLLLTGSATRILEEKIRHFPPIGEPKLIAHEKLSGRPTDLYTVESGTVKITWWIVQKGDDWEKYHPQLTPLRQSPMARLSPNFDLPGLPIKTEFRTPDGRRIVTTVLDIHEAPLEETDFAIPSGYRSLP